MSELNTYLEEGKAFHSLSIRELLEARDAYHVFLTRKKNVIGTAIGKYRIRKPGVAKNTPKTLENTEVRSFSWPCVLVFVKEWILDAQFGKSRSAPASDYLPQRLYLPDGREVPVCVIASAWQQTRPDSISSIKFPGSVIGGGYPIMAKVQGDERWATLGCLVSDGRVTYGLTNSHVTGRPGTILFTILNGNEEEIGVSSEKQLQKISFSTAYENYPGRHSFLNLDIGLIELQDMRGFTSQVYGIGDIKGVADINHDTLSLRLIGCPVLGYGTSSNIMQGEIAGLFHRYASSGGYDYVADYLIGPRSNTGRDKKSLPFSPRHGDSGALLVVNDPKSSEHMKALGVLWGGQKDVSGSQEQAYGLATNMGTICRLLDVELVCGWNTGYDRYFGAYAHIVLPSLCAGAVKNKTLKKLMENNAARFSMPLGTAVKATEGLSNAEFVPLSDVPDLVWKKRGGKFQRGREGANHFADMDQPNPEDGNRTLLDLCDDPINIDLDEWLKYYAAVGAEEKGALPFRIAQIYDAMVNYVKKGNASSFVCAAGILTHYVFDACMPLHISYMHHGDPSGPMKTVKSKGKNKKVSIAYDVHAEFDNQMVEYYVKSIEKSLPQYVHEAIQANEPVMIGEINSARQAAIAAVKLMRNTVRKYANPIAIVKDYEELADMSKRERCDALWNKYGKGYMKAMAEGVVLTARLWEAAWNCGDGKNHIKSTGQIAENDLRELYETKEGFLDSVSLQDIKDTMTWSAS
jgi:hypothetical protein